MPSKIFKKIHSEKDETSEKHSENFTNFDFYEISENTKPISKVMIVFDGDSRCFNIG